MISIQKWIEMHREEIREAFLDLPADTQFGTEKWLKEKFHTIGIENVLTPNTSIVIHSFGPSSPGSFLSFRFIIRLKPLNESKPMIILYSESLGSWKLPYKSKHCT